MRVRKKNEGRKRKKIKKRKKEKRGGTLAGAGI